MKFGRLGRSYKMRKKSTKSFDCVQSMRQIRDGISSEISEMNYNELRMWLRTRKYSDPNIKRLKELVDRQVSDFTPQS